MNFYIRANDREQYRTMRAIKSQVQKVSLDFSAWAEDNGALTGATWTVLSGNATISSEALASSVATATVTTAERGDSTIEVQGTNASYTQPVRIRVVAIDPVSTPSFDYGRHAW